MAGPYSIRVMSGRGGRRIERYTVPEGKRLVIRSVGFVHWAAPPGGTFLYVHGIPIIIIEPTAAAQLVKLDVRFTCYERETVEVHVSGTDASYAVDGYLLTDADGTPDDADNVIIPLAAAKPVELELDAGG